MKHWPIKQCAIKNRGFPSLTVITVRFVCRIVCVFDQCLITAKKGGSVNSIRSQMNNRRYEITLKIPQQDKTKQVRLQILICYATCFPHPLESYQPTISLLIRMSLTDQTYMSQEHDLSRRPSACCILQKLAGVEFQSFVRGNILPS